MWITGFFISIACLPIMMLLAYLKKYVKYENKHKITTFHLLCTGVVFAVLFIFIPIHDARLEDTFLGGWKVFFLSVFHTAQVFTVGCEFSNVELNMTGCNEWLQPYYLAWTTTLFAIAPAATFGFVLSLFKNLSAWFTYRLAFFKDAYVFSELNERSLALATDVKKNNKKSAVIFTDVFEKDDEHSYELFESAQKIGAICFKKDVLVINFKRHSKKRPIFFFTIGNNETENLNHALKLIEIYKNRKNTSVYVFSIKKESELLLTSAHKGEVKVRRISEVRSLVNRLLYEKGEELFESAREKEDGKKISAVVVGMGSHGTEFVKALTWFGQMDGYELEINAFDKDKLAEEKFVALAPELMDKKYNGIKLHGEAQYKITVHPDVDVKTNKFITEISRIKDATFVIVALGNDDANISTAVDLRMHFERMKIHPIIKAIVYNSEQCKALSGIKNYRGQKYDIEFIGDLESSYTENVIIDSELEEEALRRHLKNGKEEAFWTYEYNYRSSMASAIHMRARIKCGISGADKEEDKLTEQEREIIEALEHRRWNAYMRAEGYVYSRSKDPKSRNDLAKMHHDLVDYASLDDGEKIKDSRVGTK